MDEIQVIPSTKTAQLPVDFATKTSDFAKKLSTASADGLVRDASHGSTQALAQGFAQSNPPSQREVVLEPMDMENASVPTRTKLQNVAVVLALFLSVFVGALDQTIIATAIPTIASQLQAVSTYSWIGSAFLIANAASGSVWAKFSDIWGRKPILIAAIVIFFFSSLICALAKNITTLIAGRVIQGIGGGGLIMLPLIIISDIFSLRTRTLLMGLIEMVWAMAGGLGPVLGGILTEKADWRWIFWINLPISGVAFVLISLFLHVHNPRTPILDGVKAIDWFGGLSIIGLTVMLLMGLNFGGEEYPWDSPTVICLIVFGAAMSLIFVFSEKKVATYPIMPMSFFHNSSIVGCVLVTIFHRMSFIAASYYLPLYLQATHLASPLRSGVLIITWEVGQSLSALLTGILMHRTGSYRIFMIVGLAILTLGLGLFITFDADTPLPTIIGLEFLAGVGSGTMFNPPVIAAQAMVPQDDVAVVTAMVSFMGNLGSALSVVVCGVVVQNGMKAQSGKLQAAGLPLDMIRDFAGAEAVANVQLIPSIEDAGQQQAVKQAFASSLSNMWILATALAGLGFLSSLMIKKAVLTTEHTETITGLRPREEKSRDETVQ